MGRPEEIQDAQAKTFRLPAVLVKQLEAAAQLRKANVSDAVRDILEKSIRTYYADSRKIYIQNAQNALTTIQDDQELQQLLDKYKDRDELSIPHHIIRDPKRVQLLSAALDGYKALQAAEDVTANLFSDAPCPDEKDMSRKILLELAGRFNKGFRHLLLGLTDIVSTGDLVLRIAADGEIAFRLSPIIGLLMERSRRVAIPYVDKLAKLVANGHLHLVEKVGDGSRVFHWR